MDHDNDGLSDSASPVLTVDEVAKLLRISRKLAVASCRSGLIPRAALTVLLDSATRPST